jgi:hypothetical protein
MKRLFLFALVSIVACTKTNTSVSALSITGQWELRESIGGLAGDLKFSSGNGNIMEFHADSTLKVIEPAKITVATGTYKLSGNASSDLIIKINYDSGYQLPIMDSAKIENNKMTFSSQPSCCDMPNTIIYQKISNN